MSNIATLTSLAMLKTHIDQGKDYLDYLRPFILQVLFDKKPDPVSDGIVHNYLLDQFGLDIPSRTIQIILKRIAREQPLKLEYGIYRITGVLTNPGIAPRKAIAERHITSVISDLMQFSSACSKPLTTEGQAINALLEFLSEFCIPSLRAYLRGTTIPDITNKQRAHLVIVSEYVLYLQRTSPERFESFLVMLQGHMLANALLCPDLQNAPKTYKGVTFYLDTPLLVQRLGLEGEAKKKAIEELITLLLHLGSTVALFSHSSDELERVIKGAAYHIDSTEGRGAIVMEARRNGTTKSDLLLLAGQADKKLIEAGIIKKSTPDYKVEYQIDERAFEQILEDELFYYNSQAKQDDINSVRSIYVLRTGTVPSSVERCKAILVTSNSAFSRAAYEYGKQHNETRDVSSVITDFSLANMAWLKAPMGAPSLPATELLAYSYAALQPSKQLWDKYLFEIDKLEKQGGISARDHQLLRSSTIAHEELMRLTLGDESAFTAQTVTETLHRVTCEIKEEENEKLSAEQVAHRLTQAQLETEKTEKQELQQRLFWRCAWQAKILAWAASFLLVVVIVLGLAAGIGFRSSDPILGWSLILGLGIVTSLSLLNLLFGTTVQSIHSWVQEKLQNLLFKREARKLGIKMETK